MRLYNSTLRVKEKLCVSCGKPCIWFSKKRCTTCARNESAMAQDEKETMAEDGLPELIDDLDRLVAQYVKLKYIGKDGLIQCYTCSSRLPVKEIDCGHYISRSCMYLRFDYARNLRCQCHTCNRSKYGKAAVFAQNLEKELPGVTEILMEESRIVYKWTRHELKALISELSQKIIQVTKKG
jgi:hypothetical protein